MYAELMKRLPKDKESSGGGGGGGGGGVVFLIRD